MKISQLNFTEEIAKDIGLSAIFMHRLGNVVLIAGKNGSGKTRLLKLLKEHSESIPKSSEIEACNENLFHGEIKLTSYKEHLAILLAKYEKISERGSKESSDLEMQIKITKKAIFDVELSINESKKRLNWDIIVPDSYQDEYSIVRYVPKQLKLEDSAQKNPKQISLAADQSEVLGVEGIAQSALSKIQSVCTRYSNATNPQLSKNFTDEEIRKAIADYEKLQEYFQIYLGINIKINMDGLAEIFGFPIGTANLSNGQIILLQYCVALFNQQAKIDANILILDEPENHLHPEILLSTLDKIVQANKNGQVWIATHSINILAHFYEKDIWFMENGRISFMGRAPENVLKSLLGDNNEIEKLHQFISMPSIFATNLYAFESLKDPISVLTGDKDPQLLQIFELINKLTNANKRLKLLDFGAGKGRLLKSMSELSDESSTKIIDWLDYVAFDKYDYDKDACINLIESVYGNAQNRYYNNETTLLSHLETESFDTIMLVNVLHEISPLNWSNLFESENMIYNLLKPEGKLIIVEDQIVPNGEKAYTEGFIVFDVPEFKKLFGLQKYEFVEALNGRLKSHIFNKTNINNYSNEKLKDALKSLFHRSKREVELVREQKTTYKNGMIHGFWVQQFANVYLTLTKMGVKIE